ncbi:MAG: phosphate ABC transporter permease PstA [Firmicutes bacterium]|nr:phosphate ABC transporter permease PstA [Bacillota bacterium]MCL5039381.1 phosphate ABC transporter permease PstA [Bacillota bacterium]
MPAKKADRVATAVLTMAALSLILILAWFLLYVLRRGLPVLTPQFLTSSPRELEAGGGVGPQLFNSFYILFLSLFFSLPVGLGTGVYLAEYARPSRWTDLVRLSVESLATVPSIVLGLFGMIIFVNFFGLGFTILGGALTLALLNLPLLVRVTEEAIRAVPVSYREASLALGATQWQTVRQVVIPAALPGIITGVTLTAGRALGETAVLIYTAGTSASRHFFDLDPFNAGETLAVHLWYVRAESLVPDAGRIADGAAALLIIAVLVFNLILGLPARLVLRRLTTGGHR